MEEPTNDDANPMEHPTAEEELGQTKPSTIEEPMKSKILPPADETIPVVGKPPEKRSGPEKIGPEMQEELKRLLRGTRRGKALMIRLDQIARPDLYKNAVQVNWVKDIQSLDISIRPFDLNPGIFEQFRAYCWNNAMTYRFDDTSGVLVLAVRWFLPDVLPIMDPNLNGLAMLAPEAPASEGIIPKTVPPAKPGLKEV